MAMNAALRWLSAAALSLLLTMMMIQSVRWGVADFHAERAHRQMDTWARARALTPASWQAAESAMVQARHLDPIHPGYLQRAARLYRIRLFNLPALADYERDADRALLNLRASLSHRPYWGHAWAELAYLKWRLQETDEEFSRALSQAVHYGPWQASVIRPLMAVGLPHFEAAPADLQQIYLANLARGLRSPAHRLFADIQRQLPFYPEVHRRLAIALFPALAEQPWPDRARLNFLLSLDLLWPSYTGRERQQLAARAAEMLLKVENPGSFLNHIKRGDLRAALCRRLQADQTMAALSFCG